MQHVQLGPLADLCTSMEAYCMPWWVIILFVLDVYNAKLESLPEAQCRWLPLSRERHSWTGWELIGVADLLEERCLRFRCRFVLRFFPR